METIKECLGTVDRRLESAREMTLTPYSSSEVRAAVVLIVDATQLLRKVVEVAVRKHGLEDLEVPR